MNTIRFGFIGTGNITNCQAPAVKGSEGAELYACAARSFDKAKAFATKWDIPVAYGSYDELLADPQVDVVYIATPHMNHAELSIKAMRAGKAVLCEKPAAVNEKQLREVLAVSRETGCFFMEALWTRFHPLFAETMKLVKSGAIGDVKAIFADFCSNVPYAPGSRLYEPELAGGALLDMGIYPLMYACSVAATVQGVSLSKLDISRSVSFCRKTDKGVDAFDSITLEFPRTPRSAREKQICAASQNDASGKQNADGGDAGTDAFTAVITTSIDSGSGNRIHSAKIVGTKGTIHVPGFWYAEKLGIMSAEGELIGQRNIPFDVNGYEYEAREVVRCVNEGRSPDAQKPVLESPIHTHEDSLAICRLMDKFRAEWGIVYPFETAAPGAASAGDAATEQPAAPKFDAATFEAAAWNSAVEAAAGAALSTADAAEGRKSSGRTSVTGEDIIVFTDGSCSGNPGRGGWGAVILADGKEKRMSGGEKLTTNNRMELMGAIEALEAILDDRTLRGRPITMYCDSQYVKNGIQTWIKGWKKNGWRTAGKEPVKNQDLWMELDETVQQMSIEWKWVKGHAGNKYNEICDELAVAAGKAQ